MPAPPTLPPGEPTLVNPNEPGGTGSGVITTVSLRSNRSTSGSCSSTSIMSATPCSRSAAPVSDSWSSPMNARTSARSLAAAKRSVAAPARRAPATRANVDPNANATSTATTSSDGQRRRRSAAAHNHAASPVRPRPARHRGPRSTRAAVAIRWCRPACRGVAGTPSMTQGDALVRIGRRSEQNGRQWGRSPCSSLTTARSSVPG